MIDRREQCDEKVSINASEYQSMKKVYDLYTRKKPILEIGYRSSYASEVWNRWITEEDFQSKVTDFNKELVKKIESLEEKIERMKSLIDTCQNLTNKVLKDALKQAREA